MTIMGDNIIILKKKIKYLMSFYCVMFSLESFYYKSRVVYGVSVYIIEHYMFRLLKKIVLTMRNNKEVIMKCQLVSHKLFTLLNYV